MQVHPAKTAVPQTKKVSKTFKKAEVCLHF